MTLLRSAVIAVGVLLAAFGGVELLTRLSVADLASLMVWLAAALIIHDAVLVPALAVARRGFRRRSRLWLRVVGLVAEVTFVTVAVLTLYVVPELWAQARGTPNPTLLTGDYALRLVLAWVLAAMVVLVAARIAWRRQRRGGDGEITPRRTR